MSEFTQAIVIVAAVLFLAERAKMYTNKLLQHIVKVQVDRFHKIHEDSFEQIETSFEFWWEQEAKKKIRTNLTIEMTEEMDGEVPGEDEVNYYLMPALLSLEVHARHLAAHANMNGRDAAGIMRLTRLGGLRSLMRQKFDEHRETLERERVLLSQHGLDPEELEEHFRSNQV